MNNERWFSIDAFVAACTAAAKITEATGGMRCTIEEINTFQELLKQQGFSILPLNNNVEDKWISVEEELPEDGGRYWCYVEHQTDLGLSHFQWNCSYNETTKTFSDRYLIDGERVTHWQPLPSSPLPPQPTK